jgi:hypothetical protein
MPPLEIGVKSQSEPADASCSEYLLRIADIQFDATRRSPFDPHPTHKVKPLSVCFYCKRSVIRKIGSMTVVEIVEKISGAVA